MKNSKLILKIYQLLPGIIKCDKRVVAFITPIAEKELARVKYDVIKKKWEADVLQTKIDKLRLRL